MRILFSAALALVFATSAFSQEEPNAFRRFDISYNAISLNRVETANFWGGTLGFAVKAHPRVAIAFDIDAHRHSSSGLDIYSYRVGPRFYSHYGRRVSTFGQFLVGGTQARASTTTGGSTTTETVGGVGLKFGGGLDVHIRPWFSIRPAQFDYNYQKFGGVLDLTLDGFLLGGGVVFKMGKN